MRHSANISIQFALLVFAPFLFVGCQSSLRIVSEQADSTPITTMVNGNQFRQQESSANPIPQDPFSVHDAQIANEESVTPTLSQPAPIPMTRAQNISATTAEPTLVTSSSYGERENGFVDSLPPGTVGNLAAPPLAPIVSSSTARLWIQSESENADTDGPVFINANAPIDEETEATENIAPVEDSARPYFATIDASVEKRQVGVPNVTFPFSVDANPLLFADVSKPATSFVADGSLVQPEEGEYVVSDDVLSSNEITDSTVVLEDCPGIVDQTIDGSSCLSGCSPEMDGLCQNVSALSPISMPDEYLCDGGVQNPNIRVSNNWEVPGLELEDTIAHYDSLDGRTLVRPSNRVCIYAPRFASVRKISGAFENEQIVDTKNILSPVSAVIDEQTDRYSAVGKALAAKHDVGIGGALVFRERNRGVSLDNHVPVQEVARAIGGHQNLQFMRIGIARRSEKALLDEQIQAAAVWTEDTGAQVLIDDVEAIVDTTTQQTGIVFHTDDSGDPRLRIVKIASTHSAQPGEDVEFTLRFDNIGDQPIGNVTLIDNLTTRLEYVEKSAECTLKAQFSSEPNQGESLALRWEIEEPLRPGEGGIIRFKCTVR